VEPQRHETFEQRIETVVSTLHRSLQQPRSSGRMTHHELAPAEQLACFRESHRCRQPPERLFGGRPDKRRPVFDVRGDQRRRPRRRNSGERSHRLAASTFLFPPRLLGNQVFVSGATSGEHGQRRTGGVDAKHGQAFGDCGCHHEDAIADRRHKLPRVCPVRRFIQCVEPRGHEQPASGRDDRAGAKAPAVGCDRESRNTTDEIAIAEAGERLPDRCRDIGTQ
jgi:hypothetical protein